MTEQEKREEQKLKDCLQEALGYSDEDLLMEMEEAENALRDMDFAGAEDRIYKRIMEETAAESTEELAERKSAGSHALPRGADQWREAHGWGPENRWCRPSRKRR